MALHDDDNSQEMFRDWRDDEESWDVEEDPELRELTPDDFTTVRCPHCGKLIFEDAALCPYCKHWQMEERLTDKPLWFKITVFVCIAVLAPAVLVLVILWLRGWR
jgi:hypothetical protein